MTDINDQKRIQRLMLDSQIEFIEVMIAEFDPTGTGATTQKVKVILRRLEALRDEIRV